MDTEPEIVDDELPVVFDSGFIKAKLTSAIVWRLHIIAFCAVAGDCFGVWEKGLLAGLGLTLIV